MSGLMKKLENKVDERMRPMEREMKTLGGKMDKLCNKVDKIIEILEKKWK